MNKHLEAVSPFVIWSEEDRRLDTLAAEDEPSSLLGELLSAPERIVDRLLDPLQLQSVVLGAIATLTAGTTFFSAVVMSFHGPATMLRASVVVVVSSLLALAAAFGPIWAASVLLAARLPGSRLVGVLLTAAATGALILAAVAPLPYFLWKLDGEWWGPLSVIGAFAISGLVSGARVRRLLHLLAERVHEASTGKRDALGESERRRVAVLARVSLMIVAFTVAVGFWAFDGLALVV